MRLLNFKQDKLNQLTKLLQVENFPISNGIEYNDADTNKEVFLKIQAIYFHNTDSEKVKQTPPFEWHPYLELSNIDNPNIIIGTFPPSSYLRSQYHNNKEILSVLNKLTIEPTPIMDFFYGNLATFWKILGIEIGEQQNREDKIANVKNFLNSNRIGITDIVTSCQRENIKSPSDKDLLNVIINKELILNLTTTNQSKRLIFTSGDWEIGVNNPNTGKVRSKFSAFSLFLEAIQMLKGRIYFKIGNEFVVANDKKSAKNIKMLGQNILITFKWEIGENSSQEHVAVLMPSPSAITSRTFMNMFDFKKWLRWRNEEAFQTIKILENEINLLSKEEKKKSDKKLKLNTRLRQLGFLNEQEDIEYLFKGEMYRKALFDEQGINDLFTIQNIELN
jgi:hypothetical protein